MSRGSLHPYIGSVRKTTAFGTETGGFNDVPSILSVMSALRDALRDLPEAVFADILESEEGYLLVIDLPGATAETIDISAERNKLRVEARRSKDVAREFRFLSEERSLFLDVDLPLPPDADPSEAEATIERGVLELAIPKQAVTDKTRIPVDEA